MALRDPADEFLTSLLEQSASEAERPCEHSPIEVLSAPELVQEQAALIEECSPRYRREHKRWLARHDLWYLLVFLLHRKHFIRNERSKRWTFERCREVEADPDGHADLWPRESFKSEIITFGKTIQDILIDPDVTFGVFSHTRPIASKLVRPIKYEFEHNEELKSVFDDILWAEPRIDATRHGVPWREVAFTVRRPGNPKEATVEAWGLTDGQPTSTRFSKIVYDDVVSQDNITPLMIDQTTIALKNSFLLTASDPPVYRYVGTYQEIGDTTQHVIENNIFDLRKRGPLGADGEVAFCSDEKFSDMRNKLGTKIFALQILLDPARSKDEHDLGFKEQWLEYYDELPTRRAMNVYGVVDPAGDSPDSNSQFAMWVIGVGADKRVRVLDIVLDKLDLEDCWQVLFEAHQKWDTLRIGYEKYGMQRDIEHYRYRMREVNYHFNIVELGGPRRTKDQRIAELIPWFRDHRILLPRRMVKMLKSGQNVELCRYFREREYSLWPYNPKQNDLLDALARITEPQLGIVYPRAYGGRDFAEGAEGYAGSDGGVSGSWMSG